MREEAPLWVQQRRDGMRVRACPERADVQLVQLRHLVEEVAGAWPHPGMVPGGVGTIQLEVVHLLHVCWHRVTGGVDQRLVQVDEQDEFP